MGKFVFLPVLLIFCFIHSVSAQTIDDVLDQGNRAAQTSLQNGGAVEAIAQPAGDVPDAVSAENMLPHDLSLGGMYRQAHPVVKAVMLGLLLASIATWTVLLAKGFELWAAHRKLKKTIHHIMAAKSLAALIQAVQDEKSVGAHMARIAAEEVQASLAALDGAGSAGLKERLSSLLNRVEIHVGRRMARGTAVVATVGSIGPFVGLFGTVWGIMNAFIGISQAKTTNLAVVAPGIAEALLATAIGLAAAIPAVIIYNILVRLIGGYRQSLTDCSAAVERLVSRDLDFRKAHHGAVQQRMDWAAE